MLHTEHLRVSIIKRHAFYISSKVSIQKSRNDIYIGCKNSVFFLCHQQTFTKEIISIMKVWSQMSTNRWAAIPKPTICVECDGRGPVWTFRRATQILRYHEKFTNKAYCTMVVHIKTERRKYRSFCDTDATVDFAILQEMNSK